MTFDSLMAISVGVVFFATLTRATFGFGEGLIAMPMLTLLVDIKIAAPMMALVSVTSALGILCVDWRRVHSGAVWQLAIGAIAGVPFGMLLLTYAPEVVVKSILGLFVIAFALYSLFRPQPFTLKNDRWSAPFGFIAGILGGAYNTPGPVLVVYGALRKWSSSDFRATMQGFFLPMSAAIIGGHALYGRMTFQVGRYYLACLPVILLSLALGRWLHVRIHPERFVRIVYVLLILLGAVLVINALRS